MFDLTELKKYILTKRARKFTDVIEGFTKQLEEELENRTPDSNLINVSRITSMPTYQFAIMALENNSPTQVITTIEEIRKRYYNKDNIDNETLGFLDSIEGKAYGYIALNTKNMEMKKAFYKYAIKYFEMAYCRGYCDALLDRADLEKKMGDPYKGEEVAFRVLSESKETYTCLGELFYDFSSLVESAIRVIEGKRALIPDILDFKYAMWKYQDGAKKSINSKLYYGLSLIIYNEEGSKEQGLKIVKEAFDEFKKANKDCDKVLFASDAKLFKENIELIETRILKNNTR